MRLSLLALALLLGCGKPASLPTHTGPAIITMAPGDGLEFSWTGRDPGFVGEWMAHQESTDGASAPLPPSPPRPARP